MKTWTRILIATVSLPALPSQRALHHVADQMLHLGYGAGLGAVYGLALGKGPASLKKAAGYGLGVWLDRNETYRMDGLYGQYAVISPSRQATVTVTAHTERDAELLTAIHTEILDRL